MTPEDKTIGDSYCQSSRHHPHNDPSGKVLCCRCGKAVTDIASAGGPHNDAADAPLEVN